MLSYVSIISYLYDMTLFDIQRYSIHDGAGIRTNIFLKGCPLRCAWCSNPESQSGQPSLFFDEHMCKGFGECAGALPQAIELAEGKAIINRKAVKDPGLLRNVCPSRALTVSGEHTSVEALLAEIKKDIQFYKSDGGVTISGGEPFVQSDFLARLLPVLRQNKINVAAETCLHVAWSDIAPHLPCIDVFLADLKHLDPKKFKKHTGGDARKVIANFEKLAAAEACVVVRVPVIPGFNNSSSELEAIVDFIAGLGNVSEVHFIPFHQLGASKYRLLGMNYTFGNHKAIEEIDLNDIKQYALLLGLKVKIGG